MWGYITVRFFKMWMWGTGTANNVKKYSCQTRSQNGRKQNTNTFLQAHFHIFGSYYCTCTVG
jgi:hypothetical protein